MWFANKYRPGIFLFYFSPFIFLMAGCSRSDQPPATEPTMPPVAVDSTFTNPLLAHGADPWVVRKDSLYYYMSTAGNRIDIRKTKHMSELNRTEPITVWRPPPGTDYSKSIWAPEMHYLQGKWYIYFTATDGSDGNRRLNVLECDSQDPTHSGSWSYKSKLAVNPDIWAIDGSILQYKDSTYLIWSGWRSADISNSGHQQIYIAKMKNPWTLEGSRVMISQPDYAWEKHGDVNEGPEILKNKSGNVFLIYSASGCWTDNYCLGFLSLKAGGDPLKAEDWTKNSEPLLSTNSSSGAFGTGHCSFFKSPDGTEDWIIYHANPQPHQDCDGHRSPRMQKVDWNPQGIPYIGTPAPIDVPIIKPSGGF